MLSIVVLFLAVTTLPSRGQSPALILLSENRGDTALNPGQYMVSMADGGFAYMDGGNTLKKISPDGRLEWSQTYNIPYLHALAAADDGGFVIVCLGNSDWPECYTTIMKISPSGAMQWEKTFNGLIRAWGGDAVQAPDGGFLLLTGTTSPEAINGDGVHDEGRMYFVKLDTSGNTQWDRVQSVSPEIYIGWHMDDWHHIIRAADGGYIGIGLHGDAREAQDLIAVKVTSGGDVVSKNVYNMAISSLGDAIPGVDGGCLISVPAGSTTKLIKLGDGGELQWSRTISELTSFLSGPIADKDSYYVLGKSDIDGSSRTALVRLGADGNVLWTKPVSDNMQFITNVADGQYTLVGQGPDGSVVDHYREAMPGNVSFGDTTSFLDSKARNITLTLLRQGSVSGNVSVGIVTLNGTALAGIDFVPYNGSVLFSDSQANATIEISLLHRDLQVENLSFRLALENVTGNAVIGVPNQTEVVLSYAATPAPSLPPASNSWWPFQGSSSNTGNNSTMATDAPLPPVEKLAVPIAAIFISGSIALGWLWLGKLFDLLIGGLKSYLQGLVSFGEKKVRDTKATERVPFLLGFSSQEIAVAVIGALLLGGAFAYVKGALFALESLTLLIVVAGFTAVVHEIAHRYMAYRYKAKAEYKFWDAGVVALVITSLIGQPFATPARTIVDEADKLESKARGYIYLSGPLASVLLALAFLGLFVYGGGLSSIGKDGFKICMMACVYQMMPIAPMEGRLVFGWSKLGWGIVFLPALVLYLGVMLFLV